MDRVRLVHWNADEAQERALRLQELGFEVTYEVPGGPNFTRELQEDPPAALAIDLARLPSQGRDLAIGIRKHGATRHIPLLFIGGDPQKVERIREILPDVVYTSWDEIRDALEQAIAYPPQEPVVPESVFAAYSGRPLAAKLGIKADWVVALAGAPPGFEKTLGELPQGVQLRLQDAGPRDLTIWFARNQAQLEEGIKRMAALAEFGPLWIAWPKKAGKLASDLSQQQVRETGLATGLVDYKICSIDKVWSALLFTRRKSKKR